MMVGMLERAAPEGKIFGKSWSVKSTKSYGGGFYHTMETNIPLQAPQTLSLFPPTIQKYFQGFMEPGEDTTWEGKSSGIRDSPRMTRSLRIPTSPTKSRTSRSNLLRIPGTRGPGCLSR